MTEENEILKSCTVISFSNSTPNSFDVGEFKKLEWKLINNSTQCKTDNTDENKNPDEEN